MTMMMMMRGVEEEENGGTERVNGMERIEMEWQQDFPAAIDCLSLATWQRAPCACVRLPACLSGCVCICDQHQLTVILALSSCFT